MVGDKIAHMLVGLKNASAESKAAVTVPYSSLVERTLEVLQKAGFIESFAKKGKKVVRSIDVQLLFVDGASRIHDAKRVSRSSRRVYRGFKQMASYKRGLGIRVVTTPKGVMSEADARKAKIGGEVLFEMW